MKNQYFIIIILALIISIGCVMIHKKNTVFEPILDKDYIEYYRPLLTTTINIYKDGMSEETLLALSKVIQKMDSDVTNSNQTDIYPSIILIVDPILSKIKKRNITDEEARSALVALEFINKKYNKSPLINEIYLKLKKVLQSNVV